MAKNSGDLILRDRMQFEFDVDGNRTTLYGRFDLSQYVDPVSRAGLAIKEVLFQPRLPLNPDLPLTGAFPIIGEAYNNELNLAQHTAIKIFATTRAYENAHEVGIASPDVLCVYERQVVASPNGSDSQNYLAEDFWYGPRDLHPDGYTVVSDLLIGIATDAWTDEGGRTVELDVVLVAEPVKVTTERMNEILSQQQDL